MITIKIFSFFFFFVTPCGFVCRKEFSAEIVASKFKAKEVLRHIGNYTSNNAAENRLGPPIIIREFTFRSDKNDPKYCLMSKKVIQSESTRYKFQYSLYLETPLTHGNVHVMCRGLIYGAVAETLCHKTAVSGFDSRWKPWKVLRDLIFLSVFSSPGVHSASNRNMYPGISLRLKCGRRLQLTALPSKLCRLSK